VVVVGTSLAAVWIALGTNLLGLRIGKWTQNIGATASWMLVALLLTAAFFGSSRHITLELPAPDGNTISLWATIAYGLSGMELLGMMSGEVHDARRTVPRAALLASFCTTALYALCTFAVLVLLPPSIVSELSGLTQAAASAHPVLAPVAAGLILLSAVGQFGGLGTGVSRMPLAAGVDHLLPAAFARIHPRWATPHVAILTLGGVASMLLMLVQIGDSMRAAYQTVVSLMVISGFAPYLYLFAAAWRAGRRTSAVSGASVTLIAIACTVVPGPSVANVWLFEAKILLGTLIVVGSALAVYRVRRTA
jgi:glutamate:GABA antiporter